MTIKSQTYKNYSGLQDKMVELHIPHQQYDIEKENLVRLIESI